MKRVKHLLIAVLAFVFVIGSSAEVFAESGQFGTDPEYPQRLTVSEAGTYVLTGSMQGTIYVDPGIGDVTLILDNADIRSGNEPAIMAVSGDTLTIDVKDGTCNRISDSEENAYGTAVYSEINTVFEGNGCLQTDGSVQYGIHMINADLAFKSGKYLIVSESYAILSDGDQAGTVSFLGGFVLINTKADSLVKAENINVNGGCFKASDAVRICDVCGCCSQNSPCAVCGSCQEECSSAECCCAPTTDTPGEIIEGQTSNSAEDLVPDEESAVSIVLTDEVSNYEITEAGTYVITGTSANGGISVMQGAKGVVIILRDLDLTSTSGAALCINNDAEVQVVVEGEVILSDTAQAGDDESEDGAVIEAGSGAAVFITGDGKLEVKSENRSGIRMGEDSSLVIDGDGEINIKAKKDGVRSRSDVAVRKAKVTIDAGEHAIKADNVLTLGDDEGKGPKVDIVNSNEGLEAEVVNIKDGEIDIKASEDGISAEDTENETEASVNVTGGEITIDAEGSAIDSDGNVNLIEGEAQISSGEDSSCIDQEGELYISDDFELDCDCECDGECLNS